MQDDEKPDTATTDPTAETAATGTDDGDEKGEEQDEYIRVPKREHKAHLEKAAKFNELERERVALGERVRQLEGSATTDPRLSEQERVAREMDENYAELVQRSQPYRDPTTGQVYAGDPVAKATLLLINDRLAARQESADDRYLLDATTFDPDTGNDRALTPRERAEVREMRRKSPREFGSAKAALLAWEGERAQGALRSTAERKRQADAVVNDRERRDVVRTGRRDETGAEARERHLTAAGLAKEVARLEEAGRFEDAYKLKAKVEREGLRAG